MYLVSKKRVFLGSVGVVPRADLKRHFEQPLAGTSADAALQSHLEATFRFPEPPPPSQIGMHDYAIDFFVAKHQSGEAWEFSLGEHGFPLIWRPAVEVSSRIYSLRTKKAIVEMHIKKRLRWREYLSRVFSFGAFFGLRSPFTHADLTRLLDEAVIETLERAKAKL